MASVHNIKFFHIYVCFFFKFVLIDVYLLLKKIILCIVPTNTINFVYILFTRYINRINHKVLYYIITYITAFRLTIEHSIRKVYYNTYFDNF